MVPSVASVGNPTAHPKERSGVRSPPDAVRSRHRESYSWDSSRRPCSDVREPPAGSARAPDGGGRDAAETNVRASEASRHGPPGISEAGGGGEGALNTPRSPEGVPPRSKREAGR